MKKLSRTVFRSLGKAASRRSAGFLQSVNPATGEVMKTFDFMNMDTLNDMVDALKRSQVSFATEHTLEDRAEYIVRSLDRLLERQDEAASIMTLEMGKPVGQALGEVLKCADLMRWYAEKGPELVRADNPSELANAEVVVEPYGLIMQFAPFNFPFWQVIRFATPAFLVGNSVLLRHSHACPQTALMLQEIFTDEEFSPNTDFDTALRTVFADNPSCATLIEDSRISGTTFTGSTPTGKQIGKQSAAALKKSVLELGGSDPFVVLPDADVAMAAEIAVNARMANCGQVCISPKRFIVHEDIAEEFTAKVLEVAAVQVVGDGMDSETTVGPMARADLVDDIEGQVKQAVKDGAELLMGGSRIEDQGPGFFFEPTVLSNCSPSTPTVYYEETFGPVCAITVYSGGDDVAVEMANDTIFGLGGAVFSQDVARAEAVARQIECGIAFVNGSVASHWTLPFGGMKESGYGRECGIQGIREWSNLKSLVFAQ